MNESERQDLGMVHSVEAEAIGEPGKRTFKITATSGRGTAIVWMEKEQLFQVGVAIKRFQTEEPATSPIPAGEEPGAVDMVIAEFKAGEMSVRHDTRTGVMTLAATAMLPLEEDETETDEPLPAVEFSFAGRMAARLADRALEVCAAGRKTCPLCGGPIDPEGHFCVKTNGHRQLDALP